MENVLAGLRAALAGELIRRGLSQKETAEALGITPAAVTLYTRGKRGRALSEAIRSVEEGAIRDLADQIVERRNRGEAHDEFPLILDTAYRIMRRASEGGLGPRRMPRGNEELIRALRRRVEEEQLAAQRTMTLATGTKDEITRMILRQISTDSARHADILGAVIGQLERPSLRRPRIEDIARIKALIQEEERATEGALDARGLDPALRLLLASIDIDEEKHERLLKGLLEIDRAAVRARSEARATAERRQGRAS